MLEKVTTDSLWDYHSKSCLWEALFFITFPWVSLGYHTFSPAAFLLLHIINTHPEILGPATVLGLFSHI